MFHSMSLQVGITGLGMSRYIHIPVLEHLEETEIAAVCDIDRSVLSEFEGWTKYTSHDQMISNEDLDLVIISTPPTIRVNLVEQAGQNNTPVLLEKPTALSVETVDDLIRIQEKYEIPVSTTQNVLYFPSMQEAIQRVEDGDIGEVTAVDVVWSERKDPTGYGPNQDEWVPNFVGGSITEALPHAVYCGLAFLDDLTDEISTLWRNFQLEQWADGISIQARDDEDRLLTVRFLTQSNEKQEVQVHGTQGELLADLKRQTVSVDTTGNEDQPTRERCTESGIPVEFEDTWNRGHYRLIKTFATSLLADDDRATEPVPLEQDRDVVRLLEHAESA